MVTSKRVLAAQRIGRAVLERRSLKGFTQRSLAKAMGMRQGTIVLIERGETYPHKRTQIRLESILEWPLGTLEAVGETGVVPESESAISKDAGDGLIGMARVVIDTARQAGETLPDPQGDPPVYLAMAMNVVRTLTHAGALLTKGVRASAMGEALQLVAEINQIKDLVMRRIAQSPAGMVGHRLYVWRRDNGVELQTVSDLTAIEVERLVDLENAQPPTDGEARVLAKILGG